jgi:DNA-binding NarL/FixJ family response regulator
MLDERRSGPPRSRILAAAIEVLLGAGDVATAQSLADELSSVAASTGVAMLVASAAHVRGLLLVASGEPVAAIAELRAAAKAWRDLQLPYEMARARAALAVAYRATGDEDAAGLEADSARDTFESLGAPGTASIEPGSPAGAGVLTARETQVLRLVAAGMTNREIAAELVISEHTVSRHLQNMFLKLGVTSRAGATAYAYEHHVV